MFLQVRPDVDLLVLEAGSSIGGTWSKERLYPGLKTNTLTDDFEYTDFSMREDGAKPHDYIPGEVVHTYLERVASITGVKERTRFAIKVDEAIEAEHGWLLEGFSADGSSLSFKCQKLIVSTGRTSDPVYPRIQGQDTFDGPIYVPNDLADPSKRTALASSDVERISVLGGGKSAWDAVWLSSQMGKEVDWIIRPSGFGPSWTLDGVLPGSNNFHGSWTTAIRFLSWLSPSIWQDADGFGFVRRLIQRTWLGVLLIRGFYTAFQKEVAKSYDVANHPERKSVMPDSSPWWRGDTLGTMNFGGDFWKLLETDQVKVHRKDISSLSKGTVTFTDGTSVSSSAMIACMGWQQKPSISIPSLSDYDCTAELSASVIREKSTNEDSSSAEVHAIDNYLLQNFPILKHRPQLPEPPKSYSSTSPFSQRLLPPYRCIVPNDHIASGKRSIAFIGWASSTEYMLHCEVQSLWAAAYLTNFLTPDLHPSGPSSSTSPESSERSKSLSNLRTELTHQSLLLARWSQLRNPVSTSSRSLDLTWDKLAYRGLILGDLGIESRRKKGLLGLKIIEGKVWNPREWFEPYRVGDYRGFVGEWIEKKRLKEQS